MKILFSLMIAAGATLAPVAAQAAQFQAGASIDTGAGTSDHYVGPADYRTTLFNGSVVDDGSGAFDRFGYYNTPLAAGLTLMRRTELLDGNVYRFFDSFTNTGATRIDTSVTFFGNLGSDGDELVATPTQGLVLSCQGDPDGNGVCVEDPVLALVSGDNGLVDARITPDRYTARAALSIGAGETVSLLNYAFLARDETGPLGSDVALAESMGRALLDAPRLDGLDPARLATVANWRFAAAVPEPRGWAMMLLGVGGVGAVLRRRAPAARAG